MVINRSFHLTCIFLVSVCCVTDASGCSEDQECEKERDCIDGKCACSKRYLTGDDCATYIQDTVFNVEHKKLGHLMYYFGKTPHSYSQAKTQCHMLGGRLFSDQFTVLRQHHLNRWIESLQKEKKVDPTYMRWISDGKEGSCHVATLDFRKSHSNVSCNSKNLFICERKTEGPCYKKVAEKYCESECHETASRFVCCAEGYDYSETRTCSDVDECEQDKSICPAKLGECLNLPGSFRCTCDPGTQGNGINACGYIISLRQVVVFKDNGVKSGSQFIITHPPPNFIADEETALIGYFSASLRQKMVHHFITSIVPVGGMQNQFNITYDLYFNDSSLTPDNVIVDFQKARRTLKGYEGNSDMFTGWGDPERELGCSSKLLGYGSRRFRFLGTQPNREGLSVEKCPDGRAKAVVPCVEEKYKDGSPKIFFNHSSIKVINCNPNAKEKWFLRIRKLAKDKQKLKDENIKDQILEFSNFVKRKDVQITKSEFENVLLLVDILSGTDVHGTSVRNDSESDGSPHASVDVALAIEDLATRVEENATIDTPSIYADIKQVNVRSYSSNEDLAGIRFSEDLQSGDGHERRVRSYLPAEAIKRAINSTKQNHIPVSFIVFKEGVLFQTSHERDFSVNDVLSVSVAGVKIKKLEEPFSYQLSRASAVKQPAHTQAGFRERPSSTTKKNGRRLIRCSYLDEQTHEWKSDGCKVANLSDPPTCECEHLTNFAILVKYHKISDPYFLEVFGKFGCSLSIVALVLMLICNLRFR